MHPLTDDERLLLTRDTMQLLDDWGLQVREMMALLDMPEAVNVRNFARFRDDTPFPDEPHVMKRVHYLLRIADALRTTYPTNPQMRARWMRQTNSRFGRRTPLTTILEGGESGLMAVLAQLDCTYAWDLTGSKG